MPHQNRQPRFTEDDEKNLIRDLLRWFGRELQSRGEIPPGVPEVEIDIEMEQYVSPMIQALHGSPLYPQVEGDEGQLETLICRLLEDNLRDLSGSRGLIRKRRRRGGSQ